MKIKWHIIYGLIYEYTGTVEFLYCPQFSLMSSVGMNTGEKLGKRESHEELRLLDP
jgi:hypothetical protein